MKSRTFMFSVGGHVLLGLGMLLFSQRKEIQRVIAISSFGHDRKPEKKAEPPKPKPAPPPKKAPVRAVTQKAPVRQAPVQSATTQPPPSSKSAAGGTPFDTGLELSADGPGIAVGPVGPREAPRPVAQPRPQPVRRVAVSRPRPAVVNPTTPTAQECTEEPTRPVPLTRFEIEYSTAARAAGIEGRLVLRLFIGSNGGVSRTEVLTGLDPSLDAAAVATVARWRFMPALRCGKPVDTGVYTLARRFELGD